MLKIKLLVKSIIKYPTSLVLNVLSLLIAFTGIITMVLYISYENSYDTFNKNFDTIYKINIGKDGATVPSKISPIIKENISEIESITPFWFTNNTITTPKLKAQRVVFNERGMYADNDVFDIFTFPLVAGKKESVLTNSNTVVLTESISKKLFAETNPIDKEVLLNGQSFTVTGVIKDIPENASFHVQFICSFVTLSKTPNNFVNKWNEWSFQVFCKVNPQVDIAELQHKISYIAEFEDHFKGDDKERKSETLFFLQPLSKLHFSGNSNFNVINREVLNILAVLIFVLAIMGMVNFVNLTTAQAFSKSKILAMKRVFGAGKATVLGQVITEAVVISLFVLLLSFIAHNFLYIFLQQELGISGMGFANRAYFYLYFIEMAIVFGVLAGIYPAFYLNSPELSQSVHGAFSFSQNGKIVRTSLIILQFVFTIFLIISSIGITKQINYWHNFDIGIQKENIIVLQTTKEIRAHHQAFANELLKSKNITDYTYSNFMPGSVGMGWGRTVNGQRIIFTCWPVDERFLNFFDIEIVQGRSFSNNLKADESAFIFNEKAIEEFQWKTPLEKRIYGFSSDEPVIGVAKNFNFASLKEDIQPMVFWLFDGRRYNLILKLKPRNITETINYIKTTWGKFEPVHNVNYTFLDDALSKQYQKEERISNFIRFITLWSILLSITGLLGMVIFTTRQRTKEIGIRRVNGATALEIVNMLNMSFIKQVAVAFIIAVPVAYYALNKWFESFPYKTTLSWWIFALAGVITLFIAIVVASWHTWQAAKQNPIKSLRTE
jgi:putative ABC transport system permease protein